MPTPRTKNRHIPETSGPRVTDAYGVQLAKFVEAVVAGGEKSVKRAFDKAEQMMDELSKRTS
jgi:hypothetical protein